MFASKYLRFEGRSCMLSSAKMAGKNGYPRLLRENDPLNLDNRFQQLRISERQFARCSDVVSWKRVDVTCLVMLLSVLVRSWTLKTKPATYCTNWKHATPRFSSPKTEELLVWSRLDLQPLCEHAFLSPHHGWITGLAIVFLDQSRPSLLESSNLAVIGQFCHSFFQHGGKQYWWVFFCCKVCFRALFVSAN